MLTMPIAGNGHSASCFRSRVPQFVVTLALGLAKPAVELGFNIAYVRQKPINLDVAIVPVAGYVLTLRY